MFTRFLSFILEGSDILAFFGAISALLLTIHTYRDSKRCSIERERYDKLIFPLFDLLEPYLFTSYNDEILQKAISIMTSSKSLLGGKLLEVLYICERFPGEESFSKLCVVVNSEFDRVSRIISLKRRGFYYRINRNQFRTKLAFIGYLLFSCAFMFVCLFAFMFVIGLIVFLLEQLLPQSPTRLK